MRLKQEEVMDYTYFDDIEDLMCCVMDDIVVENQDVVIFCKSQLATQIIPKLEAFKINMLDVDARDNGNYAIFLSTSFVADCVKADGYFKDFTDEAIYVHGECDDSVVKGISGGNWCEFEFEDESDEVYTIPEYNDLLELNFTCNCCGLYVCIYPIEKDEECELWTTEMYLEDESGTRTEIVERQSFEEVKEIRDEWIENFR